MQTRVVICADVPRDRRFIFAGKYDRPKGDRKENIGTSRRKRDRISFRTRQRGGILRIRLRFGRNSGFRLDRPFHRISERRIRKLPRSGRFFIPVFRGRKTGNSIGCSSPGVYGRPEVALQCKGATVKVQSYGGSNWRWANSEILRWKSGNWQWIGSDSYSYHTYFGDGIKTSLNRINLDANREYEGRSNPEIPELPSRGPIRFKKIVSFRSNGDSEKDSKEEDTPALPFSIETPDWISDKKPDWKGAADLSFKIASRWDPQRLFLNVEVADDSILACSEGKTDCDSIEIILDSDPSLLDIGPDGGLRKTPGKRWAKIVLPVRNEEGKWKFDAKSSAKDRINVKFVKTKSGYTISCGIPWSRWIENPRTNPPRVGSVFLATVSVLDFDFPGDKGKTMSSSEIRGKDPFTFGELELSEKPYSLGGYRKGE
ncbi:hypothetical protein CH375_14900 [Leptospira ellisii]|nr:hypothetical protein CH375_14900 [Leptospira ellisii]